MVTASLQPHPDVCEVLLTPERIAERVAVVGQQLATDYADKRPLVVGVSGAGPRAGRGRLLAGRHICMHAVAAAPRTAATAAGRTVTALAAPPYHTQAPLAPCAPADP